METMQDLQVQHAENKLKNRGSLIGRAERFIALGLLLLSLGCDDLTSTTNESPQANTAQAEVGEHQGEMEPITTAGAEPGEGVTTEAEVRPNKVLVVSDSFGAGFGGTTAFPVHIEQITGIPVVNSSEGGRMTSLGHAIIGGLLEVNAPTHVVILLGTNDALFGDVNEAIGHLQAMVNISRAANATVLVGTIPPLLNSEEANGKTAQISAGIRGLSGASIVPVRNQLPASSLYDGVHPDDSGQRIIGMLFAERIK